MRKAAATPFFTFLFPLLTTDPPLKSLPGVRPSQEVKFFSDGNAFMSVTISATIVCAVITLIPSIKHRFTPQILVSSSSRFAIRGWLPRAFEPFGFLVFLLADGWVSLARGI